MKDFPPASLTRAGARMSSVVCPDVPLWKMRLRAMRDASTSARHDPKRQRVPDRVICGATRHRDGQPCEALSEPGKRRCRFHGGRSTGPKTPAGKTKALANLLKGHAHDGEHLEGGAWLKPASMACTSNMDNLGKF